MAGIVHGGGCEDVRRVVGHVRAAIRRVLRRDGVVFDASTLRSLASILASCDVSIGLVLVAHGDGEYLVQEGNPIAGAARYFEIEWWRVEPQLRRLICYGCKTRRPAARYRIRDSARKVTVFSDDILLFDGTPHGMETTNAMMDALVRAWAGQGGQERFEAEYREELRGIARRVKEKRFLNPLTRGFNKAAARLLLICIGLQVEGIGEG